MRLTLERSQFIEGGSGEMVLRDEKERIRLARLSRTPRTRSRLLRRRRDAPFVRVDKFVFFTRMHEGARSEREFSLETANKYTTIHKYFLSLFLLRVITINLIILNLLITRR